MTKISRISLIQKFPLSMIARQDFVLAAMSPAGGNQHSPVQVQKLLFVLDTELSEKIGGPHFNFQPYDYGPFDKDVYVVLKKLASQDYVTIGYFGRRYPYYLLTPTGLEKGQRTLQTLDLSSQQYVKRLSEWIMQRSFSQLVSAIYKSYPEMRKYSVFSSIS